MVPGLEGLCHGLCPVKGWGVLTAAEGFVWVVGGEVVDDLGGRVVGLVVAGGCLR